MRRWVCVFVLLALTGAAVLRHHPEEEDDSDSELKKQNADLAQVKSTLVDASVKLNLGTIAAENAMLQAQHEDAELRHHTQDIHELVLKKQHAFFEDHEKEKGLVEKIAAAKHEIARDEAEHDTLLRQESDESAHVSKLDHDIQYQRILAGESNEAVQAEQKKSLAKLDKESASVEASAKAVRSSLDAETRRHESVERRLHDKFVEVNRKEVLEASKLHRVSGLLADQEHERSLERHEANRLRTTKIHDEEAFNVLRGHHIKHERQLTTQLAYDRQSASRFQKGLDEEVAGVHLEERELASVKQENTRLTKSLTQGRTARRKAMDAEEERQRVYMDRALKREKHLHVELDMARHLLDVNTRKVALDDQLVSQLRFHVKDGDDRIRLVRSNKDRLARKVADLRRRKERLDLQVLGEQEVVNSLDRTFHSTQQQSKKLAAELDHELHTLDGKHAALKKLARDLHTRADQLDRTVDLENAKILSTRRRLDGQLRKHQQTDAGIDVLEDHDRADSAKWKHLLSRTLLHDRMIREEQQHQTARTQRLRRSTANKKRRTAMTAKSMAFLEHDRASDAAHLADNNRRIQEEMKQIASLDHERTMQKDLISQMIKKHRSHKAKLWATVGSLRGMHDRAMQENSALEETLQKDDLALSQLQQRRSLLRLSDVALDKHDQGLVAYHRKHVAEVERDLTAVDGKDETSVSHIKAFVNKKGILSGQVGKLQAQFKSAEHDVQQSEVNLKASRDADEDAARSLASLNAIVHADSARVTQLRLRAKDQQAHYHDDFEVPLENRLKSSQKILDATTKQEDALQKQLLQLQHSYNLVSGPSGVKTLRMKVRKAEERLTMEKLSRQQRILDLKKQLAELQEVMAAAD